MTASMRKASLTALATVALLVLLVSPASPATSVGYQIKQLNRKIAAVLYLVETKDISNITSSTPVVASNGSAVGAVTCPYGTTLTGGGISFNDPHIGDHVVFTKPNVAGSGWEAAISGTTNDSSNGIANVFAVCTEVS